MHGFVWVCLVWCSRQYRYFLSLSLWTVGCGDRISLLAAEFKLGLAGRLVCGGFLRSGWGWGEFTQASEMEKNSAQTPLRSSSAS
jgi:hypothetical protein